MRRVARMLALDGGRPKELHCVRWGKDGFDPKQPSGWDVRDFLSRGADVSARAELVKELINMASPIPADWIRALEALLNRNALRIQPHAGDVLLVNNLLMAHGRLPYSGNRQVRVALGDMRSHGSGALASPGQGSNTHSRRQWG